MSSYSGALMLLKIEDDKGKYIPLGGLRTTRLVMNNDIIDITHKESNGWKESLDEGGIKSISISGGGVFTDSKSEEKARNICFSNKKASYQLCFGNGDILQGNFFITSYERSGSYQDEESYNLTFESSGEIIWKKS